MNDHKQMGVGSPVPSNGARASTHSYRFGRAFSLGRNKQFTYVYRRGKSYPSRRMVLVYLRAKEMKVGFSVSAKVGNSVTRNKVRRRMKEDFRLIRPELVGGKYIFIARTSAAEAPYPAMAQEMRALLKRAGLFVSQQGGQESGASHKTEGKSGQKPERKSGQQLGQKEERGEKV
jgi:ribonuclease P protein component